MIKENQFVSYGHYGLCWVRWAPFGAAGLRRAGHWGLRTGRVVLFAGLTVSSYVLTEAWANPGRQDQPADVRPELPPFAAPGPDSAEVLPRIPLPKGPDTPSLAAEHPVVVHGFAFKGNTVITDQDLNKLAKKYLNRPIRYADLAALRDDITREYIGRGYVNSGALIPEQSLSSGILTVQIVEGHLSRIEFKTDGRYRESVVTGRIQHGMEGPLNVYELEERLKWLQQDERVDHIQAALVPGKERGESILRLDVFETPAFTGRVDIDNHETPSVGAEGLRLQLAHRNLTGHGDRLSANFSGTEGLWSGNLHYTLPVMARGTSLDMYSRRSESRLIEKGFESLKIESRSSTYGLALNYPVVRSVNHVFNLSLAAEYRRSESFFLEERIRFPSSRGVEEGPAKVAVLRLAQDWTYRTRQQVLAARSTFSFGLDAFGATPTVDERIPGGKFAAWLGQIQWARRIPALNQAQLVARLDAQLSDSPLLGMEQFAVGGHGSVRGYRENTLVRDNGWMGSLELRIPVVRGSDGRTILEVAPFVDGGRAWNNKDDTQQAQRIYSAGLATRWAITKNIQMQLDWAEALKDLPNTSINTKKDLQDRGVHFRLSVSF